MVVPLNLRTPDMGNNLVVKIHNDLGSRNRQAMERCLP